MFNEVILLRNLILQLLEIGVDLHHNIQYNNFFYKKLSSYFPTIILKLVAIFLWKDGLKVTSINYLLKPINMIAYKKFLKLFTFIFILYNYKLLETTVVKSGLRSTTAGCSTAQARVDSIFEMVIVIFWNLCVDLRINYTIY
jgi:hypothetical protein